MGYRKPKRPVCLLEAAPLRDMLLLSDVCLVDHLRKSTEPAAVVEVLIIVRHSCVPRIMRSDDTKAGQATPLRVSRVPLVWLCSPAQVRPSKSHSQSRQRAAAMAAAATAATAAC